MARRYQHAFWDSGRWEGFTHRVNDVVICSSIKAGSTWMQRICSLLIFQKTELPKYLSQVSPWLEWHDFPVEKIHADLDAQTHHRFIKSHTPLDGLPYQESNRYIYVGRDPRDIFLSLLNHMSNADGRASQRVIRRSGLEQIPPRGEPPTDFSSFLDEWLFHGCFPWEDNGWPCWSVFSHANSFWEYRHLTNILFIHYDELIADLENSMKRVASFISVEIGESIWADLVEAARFDQMKSDASLLVPGADWGAWKNNSQFFNKGTSGGWETAFSDTDLSSYVTRATQLISPELYRWLHSEI